MRYGFLVRPWATFPRPPYSSRTAGFPRSGWKRRPFTPGLPRNVSSLSDGTHSNLTLRFTCCFAGESRSHHCRLSVRRCWFFSRRLHPEPLCSGGITLRHRSYELMRQSHCLSLGLVFLIPRALATRAIHGWSVGPSRLYSADLSRSATSPTPADCRMLLTSSSPTASAFAFFGHAWLPQFSPSASSHGASDFGAADIPLCCGPPVCSSVCSLTTISSS